MTKTFKEIMDFETEDSTLMIVDGLNLAFRWKARITKSDTHPIQKDFSDEYLGVIKSLQKSYKAGKVIIACDFGYSTYRVNLFPGYKQDRRDRYATATEQEQELFKQFVSEFSKTLDKLNTVSKWKVLRYKGVEADDIAAHICNNIKFYGLKKIWLVSSDKDWSLLVTPDVSQFSYVTRKEITFDNWDEHHNCEIDEYISIKCLQGGEDGIPGIYGIGPTRALALVNKYGSAKDIYEALPLSGTAQYIKNLNESGETIPLNYKLMDLVTHCDEAIGPHLEDLRKEVESYL